MAGRMAVIGPISPRAWWREGGRERLSPRLVARPLVGVPGAGIMQAVSWKQCTLFEERTAQRKGHVAISVLLMGTPPHPPRFLISTTIYSLFLFNKWRGQRKYVFCYKEIESMT